LLFISVTRLLLPRCYGPSLLCFQEPNRKQLAPFCLPSTDTLFVKDTFYCPIQPCRSSLQSYFFLPSNSPSTFCIVIISLIRALCPTQRVHFDLVTLLISGEGWDLCIVSLCGFFVRLPVAYLRSVL
jgi:hypothetical protein